MVFEEGVVVVHLFFFSAPFPLPPILLALPGEVAGDICINI